MSDFGLWMALKGQELTMNSLWNAGFFEEEENKTKFLINELKIGEKSGRIKNFDRNKNLEQLKANFKK